MDEGQEHAREHRVLVWAVCGTECDYGLVLDCVRERERCVGVDVNQYFFSAVTVDAVRPYGNQASLVTMEYSIMASLPRAQCCTIGVKHEGEAVGEMKIIGDGSRL